MNKKAFTLLEVIIVIIIVGVLAGLALPRLFAMVEGARATEAIATIATIRSAMERSYLLNNGEYISSLSGITMHKGSNVNNLDIDYPEDSPGARFEYLVLAAVDGKSYCVIAYNAEESSKLIALGYNRTVGPNVFGTVSCGPSGTAEIDWYATEPYISVTPK